MTHSTKETHKISCDSCGEFVTATFYPDLEDMNRNLNLWFETLQEQGWVYDKETKEHGCPVCVNDPFVEDEQ